MAKRKKAASSSKSAAIRDYIAANPNAGPTEIYNTLTKKGIAVSKGLVAVVKYKKPKTAKRRGRPKGKGAVASGDAVSVADLIAAKKLADSLGGIKKTREALELLEKLA